MNDCVCLCKEGEGRGRDLEVCRGDFARVYVRVCMYVRMCISLWGTACVSDYESVHTYVCAPKCLYAYVYVVYVDVRIIQLFVFLNSCQSDPPYFSV